MLKKLNILVDIPSLEKALSIISLEDQKTTINEPTGNFFYDPWKIRPEYQNTVFEDLLNSLPKNIGEARIIVLKPGTCYHSHTDIDDRYHINLQGQYSFLINIDNEQMYPTIKDGEWYEMDAGNRHVAANFGSIDRIQIVVRKLLNFTTLSDSKEITIKPIGEKPRFLFDDQISPWLNKMNKQMLLSDFEVLQDGVKFKLHTSEIYFLESLQPNSFKVNII
jgi:hypothetical protein